MKNTAETEIITMTINPLATYPFPYEMAGITQITPFTVRDGVTYLRVLEQLRNYVVTLVPEFDSKMDEIIAEFQAGIVNAENTIVGQTNKWDDLFNAFMENVIAELEALNDIAASNLVKNTSSKLRIALDSVYANKATYEQNKISTDKTISDNKIAADKAIDDLKKFDKTVAYTANRGTASIRYEEYQGIKYTVVTLHAGGSYRPGLLRKYLDVTTNAPAVLRAREHDIEIARDKTGATIIANQSGLVHIAEFPHAEGSQVLLRGAHVVNGVARQDFNNDDYWTGSEGYGILPNGQLKGYSKLRGDSVSDMVADGVTDSFCFGPIMVENGQARNLSDRYWDDAMAIISSINFVGQKTNGDILIVQGPGVSNKSGATISQQRDIALREGCNFAISMDRGGSTQMFAGGAPLVVSSDLGYNTPDGYNKRLVADYAYTTVPVVSPRIGYPFELVTSLVPYVAGRDAMISVGPDGQVTFSGQMKREDGTAFPQGNTTLFRVPPLARPTKLVSGLLTGNVAGNVVTTGKWVYNQNDFLVRMIMCSENMLYADLDSIRWNVNI